MCVNRHHVGEFQIRAAVRCYRTPIRMVQIQNSGPSMKQPQLSFTLVGTHNVTTMLEDLSFCHLTMSILDPRSRNHLSLVFPQENWKHRSTTKDMYECLYQFCYSCQGLAASKIPFCKEVDQDTMVKAGNGAREEWAVKARKRHHYYCILLWEPL